MSNLKIHIYKIIPWVLEQIKDRGFSFLLIMLFSGYIYFEKHTDKLELNAQIAANRAEIKELQQEIKNYYKKDRIELITVVKEVKDWLEKSPCK